MKFLFSNNAVISYFTVVEDTTCEKFINDYPEIFSSDFNVLLLYLVLNRDGKWKRVFDYTTNPISLEDCPENLLGNNTYLKS